MARDGKSSNPLKRIASSLKNLHARHKERHRPTGMGFAFTDRVDYLDGRRWCELTRGVFGAMPHSEAPERNPFQGH